MSNYTAKGPKKVIQINEKELQRTPKLPCHGYSTGSSEPGSRRGSGRDGRGGTRYERSADRQDYRSGSYTRKLHTKAGEVTLSIPKLREQTFQTAIIERYRRRAVINRGSFGGDVSCGSVDSSGGRYHRGALGHAGEFINHFEAQSQCVRAYREVAEQADRRRVSVCIS